MGTYLSTPVLDKCQESGSDLEDIVTPVSWGVVDMQGWRKSMEDAHVAKTQLPLPPLYSADSNRNHNHNDDDDDDPASEEQETRKKSGKKEEEAEGNTKVFAVFDGHGGAEVARFCQLYLVEVLLSTSHWAGSGTSSTNNASLKKEEAGDGDGGGEELDVGKALVETFHSLDRMIDDEARRQELAKLRLDKPAPGETRTIDWPIPSTKHIFIPNHGNDNDDDESSSKENTTTSNENNDSATEEEEEKKDSKVSSSGTQDETNENKDAKTNGDEKKGENENSTNVTKEEENSKNDKEGTDNNDDDDDDIGEPNDKVNDESDDDDNDNDDEKEQDGEKGVVNTNNADTMSLFHRLLNMQGAGTTPNDKEQEGQNQDDNDDDNNNSNNSDSNTNQKEPESTNDTSASAPENNNNNEPVGPCASKPTKILNGRQVCNLPDHPIHAGCTAVVAVLIERNVYVANAGDSRAVLCRKNGITEALSFDHKPLQDVEMNRIQKAGGFVNQFGRVNGNLNLSRSIGDLKYKQVPGIAPCGQMITAEPDIVQVTLNPGDEFIILGCDGIWDCLTNEQAVQYVRERIDTKTPTEIGVEMLDEIISDDPRVTQGIGGDNMTIMIIDLLPHTRTLRAVEKEDQ